MERTNLDRIEARKKVFKEEGFGADTAKERSGRRRSRRRCLFIELWYNNI